MKGFTEIEGLDDEEKLSHVVTFASIRLLLTLVTHLELELFQTAFISGNLEEEIYVNQPIVFASKS